MASVNKVILVGRLGQDPEIRTFDNGGMIANVSIATSDKWTDKQTGEQRIYFCESGVIGILSKVTPVIHATQENYESLSRLYPNVEFEKPPVRKDPKEIIQAMFDSGKWFLVNYRGYGKLDNPPKNKTVTKEQFEKLINYIEDLEHGKNLVQESNNQYYKAGYNDALYHVKAFVEELMENLGEKK